MNEGEFMISECPACGEQFLKRAIGESHQCNRLIDEQSGKPAQNNDE